MQTNPADSGEFIPADQPAPADTGIKTTIKAYSATDAALAELKLKYSGRVFNVTTKDGMKSAVEAKKELRGYRTNLEKARTVEKADALAYCNLVDGEARRIRTELEALEEPIAQAIKDEEDRLEREAAEAERLRQLHITAQQERIEEFKLAPLNMIGRKPGEIQTKIDEFSDTALEGFDDDLLAIAITARDNTMRHLRGMLEQALSAEQAASVLAAERERAEKQAEAERAERDEHDRQERLKAQAMAETERVRQQAEREAEDQRRALERAEIDKQRAEIDRLRQEQADRERKDSEARAERDRVQSRLQEIRDMPADLFKSSYTVLHAAINDIGSRDLRGDFPQEPDLLVAQDVTMAVLAKLTDLAVAAREAEERAAQAEQDSIAAAQAEAERKAEAQAAAEAAERDRAASEAAARAETEAQAIAGATLQVAAFDALELLEQSGMREHLVTRKLRAVLSRRG
jgi:hypothetical protein